MTTAHVTVALVASIHLPIPHANVHLPGVGHAGQALDHYLDQVHIPALAILLSLAGALCYAASSILQQQAAAAQPPDLSLRPSLLVRLLRSKRWMLGNVADVGGYGFQFLALRVGALSLVTPLFVIGLALSIIGNAYIQGRRPNRNEWLGSLFTIVGLGVFVGVAEPGPGNPHASVLGWSLLFAATLFLTAIAIALARGTPRRRALMLSVATGILFGLTAALTEHVGHVLNIGVVHTLTNWSPYVLAAVSIAGLLVNQSAYQAGDLRWSLPLFTVLEPIIAILIGVLLFEEHISGGSPAHIGEVLGLITMVVGVFLLTNAVTAGPPKPPSEPEGPATPARARSGARGAVSNPAAVGKSVIGNPAASGPATSAPPG